MIKGIILDFDQTIVNSSKVEYLRDLRAWDKIKYNYHLVNLEPGAKELFNFLYINNIKIAIVSNAPRRRYLEGLIKHFNLRVDVVIGYEDVYKRKPNPEPMLKALKALNLNSNEVVSIGDQVNDIISSENANIHAIYYGNKLHSNKYNSQSFFEIIEILKTI